MTIALVCTALLAALLFGLGIAVSRSRQETGIGIGYPADPTHWLMKISRAHGNAAEYNPILAILMIAIASQGASRWMLWVFVIATAARFSHAAGMLMSPTLNKPQPLRFAGAGLTYVCGILLSVALLLVA